VTPRALKCDVWTQVEVNSLGNATRLAQQELATEKQVTTLTGSVKRITTLATVCIGPFQITRIVPRLFPLEKKADKNPRTAGALHAATSARGTVGTTHPQRGDDP
jgi:hypothetical protein